MSAPWQPEDIALVFVTCPRDPAYLSATLASALLGDPLAARLREISVAVDAPDLKCVHPLAGHRRVRWVARTKEENARVESYHLHRRAVLICEDDVIFRDGWLGMLLECLEEMQADGRRDFLLTAYSARSHEDPRLRRGRCYSRYVAKDFYGAQAMLYPAELLAKVRDVIWNHGVIVPEEPYDLLLKRPAVEGQRLYTTRHSLVQHVGVAGKAADPQPAGCDMGNMIGDAASEQQGKITLREGPGAEVSLRPVFWKNAMPDRGIRRNRPAIAGEGHEKIELGEGQPFAIGRENGVVLEHDGELEGTGQERPHRFGMGL
jgi:hypothetical protein